MSLARIKTGEFQVTPASDGRLTITVPIQIKRRTGRNVVTHPSGTERPREGDATPLQFALVRGHRWLAMPESGEVKSLRELARTEGVDSSYVSRMVNLTPLQRFDQRLGKHGHPIFETLAIPDRDRPHPEIQVLDTQPQDFHQSQTGTVQQIGHRSVPPIQSDQDRLNLYGGQNDR